MGDFSDRSYRGLRVWNEAMVLAEACYRLTKPFPKDELYAMTSQIRRAAASIPANIAEGAGRETQAELAHFLTIAAGSAAELDYHLLLARDLGYIGLRDYLELENAIIEIKRMLSGFQKTVKSNAQNGHQI